MGMWMDGWMEMDEWKWMDGWMGEADDDDDDDGVEY